MSTTHTINDAPARAGITTYIRSQAAGWRLTDEEVDSLVDAAMFSIDDIVADKLSDLT